jgi:hypothetical protein
MKKLLAILVLGLLLITNVAQAKNIDVGNGITLDIPKNYKYFEINYKKLKSLLVTFPNLKKQIRSKDFKEGLKLFGVGNNSKLMILVENQEALELIKKASTSSGLKEIMKDYEVLMDVPINEFVEEKFTPDLMKKLEKMSEKKATKWIEEWWAKPTQLKFLNQLSTDVLMSLLEKYNLHKYALIMTMDKKMDNDLYNSLQTIGTSQCVFDFKCKNNKDFQQYIIKEIPNWAKESSMYKDYLFEFKKIKTGINSNKDLFFYTQAVMESDMSDYNSKGELLASTKNEKIILAGSSCFENCDDFLKIIYEIFEPMGLLAKKTETKETKTETKETKKKKNWITKKKPKKKEKTDSNSNLLQQLNDLNELHKSGVLTDEEFTKAKKKLLN